MPFCQPIAKFKAHTKDSSVYSLFSMSGRYVYEQTWFNSAYPTDERFEAYTSESFKNVAEQFIRMGWLTLDESKDYNRNVTDEQRQGVRKAIADAYDYAQSIGVELKR